MCFLGLQLVVNNRDKEGAFIRANEAAQLKQQNLLQAKDNLLAEEDTEELDAVQIEAEDLEQEGIDVSILALLCQTRQNYIENVSFTLCNLRNLDNSFLTQ